MPTYIAILRGINVGGKNKIKMAELRDSFESHGLKKVATYIQSGNLVFRSNSKSEVNLAKKIQALIESDFQINIPVIVRSADSFRKTLAKNPWSDDSNLDPKLLHVAFMNKKATKSQVEKIELPAGATEKFEIVGDAIFVYYPNGMARTKLNTVFFEKRLGTICSARNWNTCQAILKMIDQV